MQRAGCGEPFVPHGSGACDDLIREFVCQPQAFGNDGAEIADRGVVGALGVVQAIKRFGNQEIEVAIALAVRVGRAVDGHVVDEIGEVCAVVEVEASGEELRRLALAGMDGDDQAWHRFQQLSHAIDRAQLQLLLGDAALAGCGGAAGEVDARGDDDDLFDDLLWCGWGCPGRGLGGGLTAWRGTSQAKACRHDGLPHPLAHDRLPVAERYRILGFFGCGRML